MRLLKCVCLFVRVEKEKNLLKGEIGDLQSQIENVSKKGVCEILGSSTKKCKRMAYFVTFYTNGLFNVNLSERTIDFLKEIPSNSAQK